MALDYIVAAPDHWIAVTDDAGEGVRVGFEVDTGFENDQVQAHVTQAMALGVPPAPVGLGFAGPVHIYANGPSVLQAPLRSPSLALNGAYALFPDGPDMWAAMDAQALVAEFLNGPQRRTRHLVASRCHPQVFARLEGFDRWLWHVADGGAEVVPDGGDLIAPGVSVTVAALGLVRSLGFRVAHVYGWDCCYGEDGRHHGVTQGHDRTRDIMVTVGERQFATTTTWAAEVRNAVGYFRLVPGLTVSVHGAGMMAAVMRLPGVF